jgi:hypothetical protein
MEWNFFHPIRREQKNHHVMNDISYYMANFLDGSGVQSALTEIIKNSEQELCIISPYLKIPIQTKNYLRSIDNKNLPVTIVYRSDFKLSDEDLTFFNDLKNLELLHCENLHSKCYINEKEGLITSMNLHEHSQTHNWEMGIRFSKQIDPKIYDDVLKELGHLLSQTKPFVPAKSVAESKQHYKAEPTRKKIKRTVFKPTEAPNKGLITKILDTVSGEAAYCIRCGKGMPKFDLQKPYCDKCYASWSRYKNVKYKEKYCHGCGMDDTKSVISFEKPTCKACFNEYYRK